MKSYVIALVAGLLLSHVFVNDGFAQTATSSNAFKSSNTLDAQLMQNELAVLDKGKFNAGSPNSYDATYNGNTNSLGDVSPKAVKDFSKNYRNVTGATWDKSSEGFRAKFILNDVKNAVYYDTKGRWAGSLKTYSEYKMPRDIRATVKREYYDYSIEMVQEVETPLSENGPTYLVYVQDTHRYKILLVHDGDMQVWQDFVK